MNRLGRIHSMIGTRQLLTIGILAALAVVAASALTFGAAFAQDNNQDQECTEPNCRVNQKNDQENNEVGGMTFN
jgi:hypothetical protein